MIDRRGRAFRAVFPMFCALGSVACGGGAGAPANAANAAHGGGLLANVDEATEHKQLMTALGPKHECIDNPKGVACDAKKENAFTFAVAFADSPRRAVFVIPSEMKVPCEQAAPRFNDLNRQFETVTLTCEGDKFAAVGVLMIPSGGLTKDDIASYTDGWLTQVATVFVANHLAEIVK